jgi:hypothetical protein
LTSDAKERRQFALLGDDMDIIAYAKAKAKMLIHVTNHRGWTTVIKMASGGILIAPQSGITVP